MSRYVTLGQYQTTYQPVTSIRNRYTEQADFFIIIIFYRMCLSTMKSNLILSKSILTIFCNGYEVSNKKLQMFFTKIKRVKKI